MKKGRFGRKEDLEERKIWKIWKKGRFGRKEDLERRKIQEE